MFSTPLTMQSEEVTSLLESDHLRLPSSLDLGLARQLWERLREAASSGAFCVDAADVQRLSTSCTQVLFAAAVAAENSGKPLRILNASQAFLSAIADLGLDDHFKKWIKQ